VSDIDNFVCLKYCASFAIVIADIANANALLLYNITDFFVLVTVVVL